MHRRPALQLPSEHRISRLQHWLTLLLVWFVAHVVALAPPSQGRAWVNRGRRWALLLLELRAMHRLAPRRGPTSTLKRCYDPLWRVRQLNGRRVAGVAIRRALRGPTPADSARLIYRALTQDAERWIARFTRRLTRRFTKLRRVIHPPLAVGPLCNTCAYAQARDTS